MNEYPTGRKRHRVEDKKLILQIEIEEYRQMGYMQSDNKRSWRDATVEDVTLIDERPIVPSPI